MRRLALLLAGGALWLTLAAIPVFADNGPHHAGGAGATAATTDGCSGCHRAHTAKASELLTSTSQTALCYTCHGTTGAGATTDVQDGQQYAPIDLGGVVTTERGPTAEGALRGGGFDNAAINSHPTSLDGPIGVLAIPASATSRHSVGQVGMAWGNGAIGSGAGTTITLNCGSCHDPHGNESYRILRPIPEASGASAGVSIADASQYKYTTQNYWDPGDPYAPQYLAKVTAWCATCHTRYNAPEGSATRSSGDPIFKFRHETTNDDDLQCVKCHVSHGSNASMGTNSQSVPWPGTSTPRGPDSSLLRIDNRGVCEKCHRK